MLQFFLGTSQTLTLGGTAVSAIWSVPAGTIANGADNILDGVAVSAIWSPAAGTIAVGADNVLDGTAVSAAWTAPAGALSTDNILLGTAISATWSVPAGTIAAASDNVLGGIAVSAAWTTVAGTIAAGTDNILTLTAISAAWSTPVGLITNTPADTITGVAVSAAWSVPSGTIAANPLALAQPVLSIQDNEDGSGAMATVIGSTIGAGNMISVQPVDGSFASSNWTAAGSLTGDGKVNMLLEPGFYWARCVSELGFAVSLSNLVYFEVTTGDDPVLEQCLIAAEARIRLLALESSYDAEGNAEPLTILVQKVPSDRHVQFPAILIAPYGSEVISPTGGTNERDDIGYPIVVVIAASDNENQELNRAIYYGWRERIRRAFNQQRLTGVDEVFTCYIEPGLITVPDTFLNRNGYVSALVLRFYSRETRGLAPA